MGWDKALTEGNANGTVRDQKKRGKRARDIPDFFFTNFPSGCLRGHLGLDLVYRPGRLGEPDVL